VINAWKNKQNANKGFTNAVDVCIIMPELFIKVKE